MNNKLCKDERLCNRVSIDNLFSAEDKMKFREFPLMVIAKECKGEEQKFPVQMMVSVSKRKIRLAVNRNLIKRRIKEVYRLNKSELYTSLEHQNRKLNICFIYLGNIPVPYSKIEDKIIVLLNRLK